jgi:hypothetical protein
MLVDRTRAAATGTETLNRCRRAAALNSCIDGLLEDMDDSAV